MSYALDLTEGQTPGHVLRSCAIGMRLAEGLGLGAQERSALYYALLLKDAGCSNNAARVASLFGTDDFAVKRTFKLIDWQDRVRLAMTAFGIVGRGRAIGTRVALLFNLARSPDATREMIEIRCHRGAGIARRMGFPDDTADAIQSLDEHWNGSGRRRSIRRAGLLHDIGKLGVSNLILDKNGPLTPDERRAIEQHPIYTHEILTRVDAFRSFARTAALHHERLDGTGYPWRLNGGALDRDARILAVADVYEALTAERPYRAAMPPARAFGIIAREAGSRLDAHLVEALHAHVAGAQPRVSSSRTATAAPSSAAVL